VYSSNCRRFRRKNEARKDGESSVCSSRSCFVLDRWLSNLFVKFLSDQDLLICFKVSFVERLLTLLE